MTPINNNLCTTKQWTCGNCETINSGETEICTGCGLHKNAFSDDNDNVTQSTYTMAGNEILAQKDDDVKDASERALNTVAKVILWIGLIISVILLLGGIASCVNNREDQGAILLIAVIPTLVSAITIQALLKVICNISNNLREINHKIK